MNNTPNKQYVRSWCPVRLDHIQLFFVLTRYAIKIVVAILLNFLCFLYKYITSHLFIYRVYLVHFKYMLFNKILRSETLNNPAHRKSCSFLCLSIWELFYRKLKNNQKVLKQEFLKLLDLWRGDVHLGIRKNNFRCTMTL